MTPPRILYVGSLRPGGNGLDRIAMFRAAGFDIVKADRFQFMQMGTRLERAFAARNHIGRGPAGFDRMLRRKASDGGYEIVFVDKGVWVRLSTLRALKAGAATGFAVHYTPDAQFLENQSRHFLRALPFYDLAVTTKPFEVPYYTAAGARRVELIHQGYGERLSPLPQDDIPDNLRSEVCFIGHCQPHYAKLLEAVAAKVPLKIWGPNWTAYAQRNAWAQKVVQGDTCYGKDYARALSGAKIAIGLLSKRIPETTTTRTFEIPACGTMLLAERTDAHQELFQEGIEAEFFNDADECIEKLEIYLSDAERRERLARAGLQRCINSNYTTAGQFGRVIDWMQTKIIPPTCTVSARAFSSEKLASP